MRQTAIAVTDTKTAGFSRLIQAGLKPTKPTGAAPATVFVTGWSATKPHAALHSRLLDLHDDGACNRRWPAKRSIYITNKRWEK